MGYKNLDTKTKQLKFCDDEDSDFYFAFEIRYVEIFCEKPHSCSVYCSFSSIVLFYIILKKAREGPLI
jgi:hypothetical protein